MALIVTQSGITQFMEDRGFQGVKIAILKGAFDKRNEVSPADIRFSEHLSGTEKGGEFGIRFSTREIIPLAVVDRNDVSVIDDLEEGDPRQFPMDIQEAFHKGTDELDVLIAGKVIV
jgi:hypothetical protein